MGVVEHRSVPRLASRGKQRRPFEDRLAARFPSLGRRLGALLNRAVLRVPRHWRVRTWLIEYATWRDLDFSVGAIEEFGRGVFVHHLHQRGVARDSGMAVEMETFQLTEARDGLIWRVKNFSERPPAVEAAKARS
jgi:hypothetical protein